jgi:hypothetical protein
MRLSRCGAASCESALHYLETLLASPDSDACHAYPIRAHCPAAFGVIVNRHRRAHGRYRPRPRRHRRGIEDKWCAGRPRVTEVRHTAVAAGTADIDTTNMTYLGRTHGTSSPSLLPRRREGAPPRSRRQATAHQAMLPSHFATELKKHRAEHVSVWEPTFARGYVKATVIFSCL